MTSSTRLRDLVRDIRSSRTAAEERLVVNRECALIRDNFREEDGTYRCRNVAKLLYIHMLGYPAHFGQLDCLKLIASPKFNDKRIGYLGAMLLLDEKSDVHVLVTNSLKNDFSHSNQYIASLALCTLGSICSTEMSGDLVTEVEKLIKSSNVYLRKKAILCAFRMSKKVPNLVEMFVPCTRNLLNDKNHAVMLTAVTLITEMCQHSPDMLIYFRRMVPSLVRILKNLITAGYSPEHEVNGVTDPFLQVKVLKLLRILGRGDNDASDAMNDILTQVATNTVTSKNVGHAILYEIVLTIMGVESEAGLRVLAVNILGRFLLNNDKNIRYVALSTLQEVVIIDYKSVQRHRSTIVECLIDPDVSIQKRAVELCFVLINSSNIRGITKELITFLEKCDIEFKADCCSNLVLSAEKYAPNKRWHLETMLLLLLTAGSYAREDVLTSLVAVIAQNSELHPYAVMRLYSALQHHQANHSSALLQIAAWSIGEYGEHLLVAQHIGVSDDDVITDTNKDTCTYVPNCTTPVSEHELLSVLQTPLLSSTINQVTKQMLQMCLMKLSTRLKEDASIMKIRQLVNIHSTSVNIELQQRSIEFSTIFRNHDTLRVGLLETIPMLESRVITSYTQANTHDSADQERCVTSEPSKQSNGVMPDQTANLLDLMSSESQVNQNGNGVRNGDHQPGESIFDLLGDLSLRYNEVPINNYAVQHDHILSNPTTEINTSQILAPFTIYESNDGIKLTFSFEKISSTQSTITLHAINNGVHPIHGFSFQAAVPKSFQLALLAPSSDSLSPAGGNITQLLKLTNYSKQAWKMKIKVQYRLNGETKCVQHQLNTFPSELWC